MLEVIGVIAIVYVIFRLLVGRKTNTKEVTEEKKYQELKEEIEQGAEEYRRIAAESRDPTKARSPINYGGAILFLFLVIAPIISVTAALMQSEAVADVNVLLAEIDRSYPERPYTAAALPANLTEDFVNFSDLPSSWKQRRACPEGSRGNSKSDTQCWSLLVDSDHYLTVVIHNINRYDCKNTIQSIHLNSLRRIRFLSIVDPGTASREYPITLDGLDNNDKLTIMKKMVTRCDDREYSQLAFVF